MKIKDFWVAEGKTLNLKKHKPSWTGDYKTKEDAVADWVLVDEVLGQGHAPGLLGQVVGPGGGRHGLGGGQGRAHGQGEDQRRQRASERAGHGDSFEEWKGRTLNCHGAPPRRSSCPASRISGPSPGSGSR